MPAHPRRRFRTRVRPFTATILVTLVAVATLATAGLTTGFARDLLYTGRLIGTAEAASHGLVTRSAPEHRLDAAVDGLVRSLAAHPPEAVRAAKRAVEIGLAPAIAAARAADGAPVVTYAQFQRRITEFLTSQDSGA